MTEAVERLVSQIQSQEAQMEELYLRVERALADPTARQLATRMLRAHRFQMATLDLLARGLVPEKFHCFGSVTHDDVNVRRGPSAREDRTGVVGQGVPVIVKEFQGNWAHIQMPDGKSGWVFKDYVRCEH